MGQPRCPGCSRRLRCFELEPGVWAWECSCHPQHVIVRDKDRRAAMAFLERQRERMDPKLFVHLAA